MRRQLVPIMLMILDASIVAITPFIALFIRYEGTVSTSNLDMILRNLPLIILLWVAPFHLFKLYHRLWRYASVNELIAIMVAVTLGSVLFYASFFLLGDSMPRSVYLLIWFLNIAFVGGSRMFVRVLKHAQNVNRNTHSRVLIVGADDAGAVLARSLMEKSTDKKLIGFIDDDAEKHGRRLFGVPVLGGIDQLKNWLEQLKINEVLVASSSLDTVMLDSISESCVQANCQLKLTGGFMSPEGAATLKQSRIGFSPQRVCVVGLGYIGLPTASLLATRDFVVHGVDISQHCVDVINAGEVPFYEPELDLMLKAATSSGRLTASTKPVPADVFILCVPTPFKENHKPNLEFIQAAIESM